MNDPHVEALYYKLTHGEFVDYKKAPPLEYETDEFNVVLKDDQATTTFLSQYQKSVSDAAILLEAMVSRDGGLFL